MREVLAADIGGTNIRLALVNSEGKIEDETRIETRLSQFHPENQMEAENHLIEVLADAIAPFADSHNAIDLGIGFPGFFRGNSGILAASPNLPHIIEFNLAARLQDRLKLRIHLQNDALCAAIGEHRFGVGKGKRSLLHITLGTGVGGGLILNNVPYTGERGMAMEFGHLRVEHQHGRPCGCGNSGCLEAYASATAVAKRFAESSGIACDARFVYEYACDGNREAASVLQQAGFYLGLAIAETIKLLDIETVSISGGLSHAWTAIHPPLMAELESNLIPPLRGQVEVIRSTLGDQAGILGAAALAQQNQQH